MNKTLSLIEEENEEEFFTNNDGEDRKSIYTISSSQHNYYPRGSLNAINNKNNTQHNNN